MGTGHRSRPWLGPATVGPGRRARDRGPRDAQADPQDDPRHPRAAGRSDPIAILPPRSGPAPELVPLRHARMAESAFAYYRGAPAVMAARPRRGRPDATSSSRPAATPTSPTSGCSRRPSGRSSSTPTTSTRPCPGPGSGTSSASRRASSSPAARNGFTRRRRPRPPTLATVRTYRERWRDTPGCGCSTSGTTRSRPRTSAASLTRASPSSRAQRRRAASRPLDAHLREGSRQGPAARQRSAHDRRSTAQWRIVDDPPVVTHIEIPGGAAALAKTFRDYRAIDGREPARARRALPVRRLRAQGGRCRQRRDPLLHRPARGPRRGAIR